MYFDEDPPIPTNFISNSVSLFVNEEKKNVDSKIEGKENNKNIKKENKIQIRKVKMIKPTKKNKFHSNTSTRNQTHFTGLGNNTNNNKDNSFDWNNDLLFQDFSEQNQNSTPFPNIKTNEMKFSRDPEQNLKKKKDFLERPNVLGVNIISENENKNEYENKNQNKNKNESKNLNNQRNTQRTKIIPISKKKHKKIKRRIRTRSQTKLLKEKGESVPELALSFPQSTESVKQRKRRRRGSGEKKNKMSLKTTNEKYGGKQIIKNTKEKHSKSAPDYTTDYVPYRKTRKKGKRKKKDWSKMGVTLTEEEKKKWREIYSKPQKNLTEKQKRDRKLLRDRISARHSRQKKKEYISSLEDQVTSLEKEKSLVDKRMMDLEEENKSFHEEIKKLRELAFSENILTAPLLSQLTISGVSEKKK
ncbi:basic-leucine zipper transcription factor f-related [Anaeramoeba flamelloides]|uniref:Basic-leucine zipper transcription factor f-related n=1 Tax=Anaeramoeba flamelloides TaxID=1746091 RepID=A0AAV7ZZ72_9EUKA|nr:basic-leucine zipper transcription factor f-related [Anaeramoeba flamelloides]